MNKKIYELTAIIALVLSGILAFFDFKISLGILTASIFSMINLYLLSYTMKQILKAEKKNGGIMFLLSICRFLLLAAVMYLAMRFRDTISIIGVAIGLTLFMIALVIDAVKKKGGVQE
ncbi:MAG: ATP synthase subunit I [Erysipelotrichaceae bacterium]|nr:ATP synthase subunit I [Erysipelotrichaceae bacterium]